MSRCLASVKAWAQRSGFAYQFVGDELFDLCGADYLARVGDNKRSITNLARLELVRNALQQGFDRAIWFDADMFVFAPGQLAIDIVDGYAFCKEAWISRTESGEIACERVVNNAAFVFTRNQPDLDLLIALIRHVATHHELMSNYQVGGWMLTGLERTLDFALLRTIGMLSPHLIHAIVAGDTAVLQRHGMEFADPVYAANMCLSLETATSQQLMVAAMDLLEETRGEVLNRYVPAIHPHPAGVHWTQYRY
jgi:hypothetical protein